MSEKTNTKVLRAVTQRVVDRFTGNAALFTALDVSNAVKQTLSDVRHREVSPLVRELFSRRAMGDYKQTTIEVLADGSTNAQAFLYHLPEDPPSLYDDAMRSQLAIPPVHGGDGDDDDALGAAVSESPVPVGKDGRGRLARQLVLNAGIDTDAVLLEGDPHAPSIALTASDGNAPPGAGMLTAVATFDHPSLLHIPRGVMSVFDPGTKLVARVVNGSVQIVPR